MVQVQVLPLIDQATALQRGKERTPGTREEGGPSEHAVMLWAPPLSPELLGRGHLCVPPLLRAREKQVLLSLSSQTRRGRPCPEGPV